MFKIPISRFHVFLFLTLLILSNSKVDAQSSDDKKASNYKSVQFAKHTASGIDESRKNAITRAVESVSPAVVGINVTAVVSHTLDPFWQFFYGSRSYRENVQSLGSGFIISRDGYIVTNDHVAGQATKIVVTMTNGQKIDAKLIGTDPRTDVALIKMDTKEDVPFLNLGNSDDVIVGEWGIAFGNPFGLFSASAKPTVTVGVISATNMYLEEREERIYLHMIQTDASINQGNSGGPLVNSLGEVIGVNTVIVSPNQGGSVGVGFAIPINRVKQIVEILKKYGKVDRTINYGLSVQPVNKAIARAYQLEHIEGVIVTDVDRNGAAYKSGLEVADVLLRANDEPIFSVENLRAKIFYSIRGETVKLDVLRNKKHLTLNLELN